MKMINPYLMFDGECREAVEFYAKAMDAKLEISLYGDMQKEKGPGADRVMHAKLTHGDAVLMASDAQMGMPVNKGDSVWIALAMESEDEQTKVFEALSAGGNVTMPLQDTFWGARFGMLIDKFGMHWMLNYDKPQA